MNRVDVRHSVQHGISRTILVYLNLVSREFIEHLTKSLILLHEPLSRVVQLFDIILVASNLGVPYVHSKTDAFDMLSSSPHSEFKEGSNIEFKEGSNKPSSVQFDVALASWHATQCAPHQLCLL